MSLHFVTSLLLVFEAERKVGGPPKMVLISESGLSGGKVTGLLSKKEGVSPPNPHPY